MLTTALVVIAAFLVCGCAQLYISRSPQKMQPTRGEDAMKKVFVSRGIFEPSLHIDYDQINALGLRRFVLISVKDFPGLENGQGLCTNFLQHLFRLYGLDKMQQEIFLEGLGDNPEYIDVYRLFQDYITEWYLGGNPYKRVAIIYTKHSNCECLEEEDELGRDVCCVGRALEMVFQPVRPYDHAAA